MSVGWSGAWRGLGVPSSWGRGDWGFAIPHPTLLRRDLASGIPHTAAAGD